MIHTVNLPVETLTHIVNIDDPRVLVPTTDVKQFSMETSNDAKPIRSMYGIPVVNDKLVDFGTEISYLTQFVKSNIKETNAVRYFKLRIRFFPSEKEVDMIIPSYVKLYSRTAKSYVPVEFARKSDILVDYTGNITQILSNELIEDYNPTEYYSLKVSVNNPEHLITFYFNGILANVCFNDFDIKLKEI
jgi:hypothetical protein